MHGIKLDRILELLQSLAVDLKAPRSPPAEVPPPTTVTNEHFQAPALSNNVYTGRDELLKEVKAAFLISTSKSEENSLQHSLPPSYSPLSIAETRGSSPQLSDESGQSSPSSDESHTQKRFVLFGLSGSGKNRVLSQILRKNPKAVSILDSHASSGYTS